MLTRWTRKKRPRFGAETKHDRPGERPSAAGGRNCVEANGEKDPFQYDLPQGKIIRRRPDNILEINIGSNAPVKPGLTFTVLPSDFPERAGSRGCR